MATKKKPIKYTSREFDTIKSELVKYARRYYPDVYQDFTAASFGSIALDSVAYVGDMLSFYLDYQVNELFLDTATEYNNILKLGAQLGYHYKGRPGSVGIVDVFAIIPANSTGLGPDENYMPIMEAGSECASIGGTIFTFVDDVRFDDPKNEVVVARVNETTGIPTHYAVRATSEVISGKVKTAIKIIGPYEKFKKVKISNSSVSEVMSVVDSSGHEYFEVDYLSQNVVYRNVANRGSDSNNVPSILRPFVVPRRFVTERLKNVTYLQFGHGSESELVQSSIAEPSEATLQLHGRNYVTDQSFDPSKLMSTDKFGVAPADTTLTIKYRVNNSTSVNASVGELSILKSKNLRFKDSTSLSSALMEEISNSLEVSNSAPIAGGLSIPDTTEIKRRIKDSFATQNRAVTRQDIEAVAYMMPLKYGAIKRCRVRKAHSCTTSRNLEIYVLSEDKNGKLMTATDTLKQNLKLWLAEKKMMNDTIDIRDAKIVNFGIEFTVIAHPDENKYEVLNNAIRAIQKLMKEPLYVAEPLYITDIYNALNKVSGVVDARDVKIVNKAGTNYSSISVDIDIMLSADGLTVETPENVALEVKFPSSDIKGAIYNGG
jgi:hypothetical protein